MNNWITIAPILIPIAMAIMTLLSAHHLIRQRIIALIGSILLVISTIICLQHISISRYLTMTIGNWPPPFGIEIVIDMLSTLMLLMTSIIGVCIVIYSYTDLDHRFGSAGFYPAYSILLLGVNGAYTTGDLFNLYVWFEVILIASFVLLTLGNKKGQLAGAVKYSVLNLIATLLLLIGIACLYGVTGTLNMADLAQHVLTLQKTGLMTTISIIFILAFSMKAALFPLFFWLPASYPNTSFSTSGLFAGLLTKVGVYSLIRIFSLIFTAKHHYLNHVLLVMILLTLIFGVLAAIAQQELRRSLSYALVSHIGYMLIGLVLFTQIAFTGSLYYMLQHMLVISALFLVAGNINYLTGSTRMHAGRMLIQSNPYFSSMCFLLLMALSGLPPTASFWGKFLLIQATWQSHYFITLVIILISSLLTLYVAIQIWHALFLRAPIEYTINTKEPLTLLQQASLLIPISVLLISIIWLSLFPQTFLSYVTIAAHQLTHPNAYIKAALFNTGGL